MRWLIAVLLILGCKTQISVDEGESESEAEAETESEAEAEAESEAEAEAESEAEAEAEAESEGEPGPDASVDAPQDAGSDAPPDSGSDAPPDAGIDAPPDAAVDAPLDAGPDASTDAALDATPDVGSDTAPDASPDGEPPCLPAENCSTAEDDNCDGVANEGCPTCPGPNLVTNPGCEAAPGPEWLIVENAPVNGTLSQDCTSAQAGSCSCLVTVTPPGWGDGDDLMLVQEDIALMAGQYELCFFVADGAGKEVRAMIQPGGAPVTLWMGTVTSWQGICAFVNTALGPHDLWFEIDDGTANPVRFDSVSLRLCP